MKHITIEYSNDLIDLESPTYGTYKVRRIATFNMIDALYDKKFVDMYNIYTDFRNEWTCKKVVKIKSIERMEQKIYNFHFYTAFLDDNKDWVDPRRICKILPVGISRKYFDKIKQKYQ